MFLGGVFAANAQTTPGTPQSAEATLNVKLYPIQTIIVNPLNKTVNLEFTSVTEYANGVDQDQEDHLQVYSTGGFQINVKALGNLTSSGAGTIDLADIKVTASPGTTNALTDTAAGTYKSVDLTTANQLLVDNAVGGINKSINVNYAALGGATYVDKYINGQNPTVYTTEVTYTISPK